MKTLSARLVDAAVFGIGLGFVTAAAAEPRRAEELEQLRINTAYVIAPGELEMDIVPTFFDYDGAEHHEIEAELEYAISERFMLEVEVPYRRRNLDGGGRDLDGTGNVEVGAKGLVTDRGRFAVGFNVGVELPSGSHRPGIADDLWGVELSMPVSVQFPERSMSLHIEPGVEWEEHEGFEEQLLNIAVEHRPAGRNYALQLGSNFVHEEGDVAAYLIPAFEVAATTVPFQFGMGVAAGLTSESANWGVLLDFEVEF